MTNRRLLSHPLWQSIAIFVVAYVVIEFGIPALPGSAIVPKSVAFEYMTMIFVALLLYVSADDDRWALFQEPLHAMLVEPHLRVVRTVVLLVVTLLVGWITFAEARTSVSAPPNLRSIHPAPPEEITFRGQSMNLAGLANHLREHPDSLEAYAAEGKTVYYQNCLPCHGDHLDGGGHFAEGFNPLPANFQDNGTIAQLTESFVFWRVAKGGPGLPIEGTPWNSAMPVWEAFLTERQIWSAIIFLYHQTGAVPRSWEKVGGAK